MPELPELELARRNMERWLEGRRVVDARAAKGRTFRGASKAGFERVRGPLAFARRKGKYLMLGFQDGQGLLLHFGMTGKLVRRREGEAVSHSRARLLLDDASVIHFQDPRLFGRIEPAKAEALPALPVIQALGPDALLEAPSGALLKELLGRGDRELKVALMDQSKLAGLGNLHAAEALFRARLHPSRRTSSLRTADWERLAEGIAQTLQFALEAQGQDELQYVEEPGAENPFFVYGRKGQPCRRCGALIQSYPQAGRTTFFCPRCQPKPRSKR